MQSNSLCQPWWVLLLAMLYAGSATADTCMVAPTDKKTVAGRFGKFRPGGAGNHGSAQKAPHAHNGLDFSTSGVEKPVYATADGVVLYAGQSTTAGNMINIRRPSGDVMQYMHLSSFDPAIKTGASVKVGQVVGFSGKTPLPKPGEKPMDIHLHYGYATARKDEVRFKVFRENAGKGPFNPAQLPSAHQTKVNAAFHTDPSPFFCETFPIYDSQPQHVKILGPDTKAQYAILFGSVPSGGVPPASTGASDAQVAAANIDVIAAKAEGQEVKDYLPNDAGYGALPGPPIGGYENFSAVEMLRTEAMRRFSDSTWSAELTKVDARALLIDFTRAAAVGNYMTEAIYRKRERIEALIAVLAARRANATFERHLSTMHERAALDKMSRAIK